VYDCTELDKGSSWLQMSMDVDCTTVTYFSWTGFAGSIALFSYVLGIPAFAYLILRKNQHHLHEPKKRAMFGFLTNGYNLQRAWYWEVIVMLRKTSVVAVAVLFRPAGPQTQCVVTLLVIVTCIAMHVSKRPYDFQLLHDLDLGALIISLITLLFVLLFIKSEDKANLKESTKLGIGSLVIFINLAFILWFVYKVSRDIKAKLKGMLRNVPGNIKFLKKQIADVLVVVKIIKTVKKEIMTMTSILNYRILMYRR